LRRTSARKEAEANYMLKIVIICTDYLSSLNVLKSRPVRWEGQDRTHERNRVKGKMISISVVLFN
jgi:hypothetical protein